MSLHPQQFIMPPSSQPFDPPTRLEVVNGFMGSKMLRDPLTGACFPYPATSPSAHPSHSTPASSVAKQPTSIPPSIPTFSYMHFTPSSQPSSIPVGLPASFTGLLHSATNEAENAARLASLQEQSRQWREEQLRKAAKASTQSQSNQHRSAFSVPKKSPSASSSKPSPPRRKTIFGDPMPTASFPPLPPLCSTASSPPAFIPNPHFSQSDLREKLSECMQPHQVEQYMAKVEGTRIPGLAEMSNASALSSTCANPQHHPLGTTALNSLLRGPVGPPPQKSPIETTTPNRMVNPMIGSIFTRGSVNPTPIQTPLTSKPAPMEQNIPPSTAQKSPYLTIPQLVTPEEMRRLADSVPRVFEFPIPPPLLGDGHLKSSLQPKPSPVAQAVHATHAAAEKSPTAFPLLHSPLSSFAAVANSVKSAEKKDTRTITDHISDYMIFLEDQHNAQEKAKKELLLQARVSAIEGQANVAPQLSSPVTLHTGPKPAIITNHSEPMRIEVTGCNSSVDPSPLSGASFSSSSTIAAFTSPNNNNYAVSAVSPTTSEASRMLACRALFHHDIILTRDDGTTLKRKASEDIAPSAPSTSQQSQPAISTKKSLIYADGFTYIKKARKHHSSSSPSAIVLCTEREAVGCMAEGVLMENGKVRLIHSHGGHWEDPKAGAKKMTKRLHYQRMREEYAATMEEVYERVVANHRPDSVLRLDADSINLVEIARNPVSQ